MSPLKKPECLLYFLARSTPAFVFKVVGKSLNGMVVEVVVSPHKLISERVEIAKGTIKMTVGHIHMHMRRESVVASRRRKREREREMQEQCKQHKVCTLFTTGYLFIVT